MYDNTVYSADMFTEYATWMQPPGMQCPYRSVCCTCVLATVTSIIGRLGSTAVHTYRFIFIVRSESSDVNLLLAMSTTVMGHDMHDMAQIGGRLVFALDLTAKLHPVRVK
jgi:hypothetical protein